MTTKVKVVLFECGICDHLHPWPFTGDCREDKSRYAGVEDYVERNGWSVDDIEVRSMCDRLAADVVKDECPWHEEEP